MNVSKVRIFFPSFMLFLIIFLSIQNNRKVNLTLILQSSFSLFKKFNSIIEIKLIHVSLFLIIFIIYS